VVPVFELELDLASVAGGVEEGFALPREVVIVASRRASVLGRDGIFRINRRVVVGAVTDGSISPAQSRVSAEFVFQDPPPFRPFGVAIGRE